MSNDIIPGTGNWSFGIARWIYEPLIEELEELGYAENDNLFICYYDWRQMNHTIVETYLKPMIAEVKKKYPHDKIDIICHSMGGLVARTYIQSREYQYDFEKVIMIGTPNKGSVDAYYLWSTGTLLKKNNKSNFYNLVYRGYIWILLKLLNLSFGIENLEEIHKNLPSIGELIPCADYGNVLCYDDGNGKWKTVPQYYMKYRNYFLDELNANHTLLQYRVKEFYNIVGYNFSTVEYLMIDKEKLTNNYEEVILDSVETLDGDGTVTLKSAGIQTDKQYYMEANHRNIVEEGFSYIKKIYTPEVSVKPKEKTKMQDNTLHIIFSGAPKIKIQNEERLVIQLEEGSINTPYPYIYEGNIQGYKWVVLKDISKGTYYAQVDNEESENIQILVMAEGLKEPYNQQEIKAFNYNHAFQFKIH